ncbi:MAG: hypothetical protein WCE72_06385, partial [Pseudolabrys sp.]
ICIAARFACQFVVSFSAPMELASGTIAACTVRSISIGFLVVRRLPNAGRQVVRSSLLRLEEFRYRIERT